MIHNRLKSCCEKCVNIEACAETNMDHGRYDDGTCRNEPITVFGCKHMHVCKKYIESKQKNADWVRQLDNTDLAEAMIRRIDKLCFARIELWVGDFNGISESGEEALKMELEWLESERE